MIKIKKNKTKQTILIVMKLLHEKRYKIRASIISTRLVRVRGMKKIKIK